MNFKNDELDICDLDNSKICDSCEKCLEISENDYMEIRLDGLIKETEGFYKEYEEFEIFNKEDKCKEGEIEVDYEFIEDHKELREKYNNDILDILKNKE